MIEEYEGEEMKNKVNIMIGLALLIMVSLFDAGIECTLFPDNFTSIGFSAIVTVSVLSLTLLSIILDSDYAVLGVPFKKFSKFINFPIKYKRFYIILITIVIYSFLAFIFDLPFTMILLFLATMIWIGLYTLKYYEYLTNNELVSEFLTDKVSIEIYGDEIEKHIITELSTFEDMQSNEAEFLRKHYKSVKKQRQELREDNALRE